MSENNRKRMKSILVTGCAGFIRSNFVPYFLEKNPQHHIINVDLPTYAGNLENLKKIEENECYSFVKGDIGNRELLEYLFTEQDIRGVIHFAAESYVDNFITNTGVFSETNVNGIFILIDVVYKYWMEKLIVHKSGYEECRFYHISTDEVYGTLGEEGLLTEETSSLCTKFAILCFQGRA